jgi:subtilisin family serine protease
LKGEIVSLCETLHDASGQGAVIVAAAGNEHNGEGEPPPAQLPAAYDFVLAAEASNEEGKRACFSNRGDVRAPGGEGGPVGQDGCASVVHKCSADCTEKCSDGVIGPVLFPPNGNAYWPTHYGYWSGTSFSAPLVSGLAALVLEADGVQSGSGDVEPQGVSNQDLVSETVLCGAKATAPAGVINVTATLTDCLR